MKVQRDSGTNDVSMVGNETVGHEVSLSLPSAPTSHEIHAALMRLLIERSHRVASPKAKEINQ
jgi:hypothetical protein